MFSSIKYDPATYWNERGKNLDKENLYNKEKYRIQEELLLDYLKKIKFSKILELGCGYGRITELIIKNFQVERYVAMDISSYLIEKAKSNPNIKTVQFQVNDITNLSTIENFDLVISSEALMHVKPEKIKQVIDNIISISDKHVINIDWFDDQVPKIKFGHNFIHDYKKMYSSKENVKITEVGIPIEPPSVLYHVEKVANS